MSKNKSGKIGSLFLIIIIILLILCIGGFLIIIANTNDNNPVEEKTIKELEKEKEDKNKENKDLQSEKRLLELIENLDYTNEKEIYKTKPLIINEEENDNNNGIYNINTGKKIIPNASTLDWYGSFGILRDNKNNTIIDEEGKAIFTTEKELYYYPSTKEWFYNNNLYDTTGLIDKNVYTVDKDGNYFVKQEDNTIILENSKLKTIYTIDVENDKVSSAKLDTIYDEQYVYIETNNLDIIVNANNGKEVYKDKANIEYLGDNTFIIDDNSYFIKDDKLAIKIEKKIKSVEASLSNIALGNRVFDVATLKEVDSHTFIPNKDDALVEKLTGLELTSCRDSYGLKYKGETLLDCDYYNIIFFNPNITKSLLSSNKLYVMIMKDEYNKELYDVYNKKIVQYNVNDYSSNSPLITIYEDENIYVYNIIDATKTPNKNGYDVELYEDYYILEEDHADVYYNLDYKEIIRIKD